MTRAGRNSQAGFGLLEASLVIAMLSMIGVAAFSSLSSAQRSSTAPQVSLEMRSSEDIVRGRMRLELRLPMPEGAIASPGRPGYLEGWLPGGTGGGTTQQRTRYLVNAALVAPAASRYRADSANLLGGQIQPRAAANGLDFCLTLINEERAGNALPGGRRLAYGLQKSMATGTVPRQEFLPDGDALMETRLFGYAELASDLGCYKAMSDLSSSVKDAAVYMDALRVAEEGVVIRALAVKSSEQSVDLLHMRMVIWSTGQTTSIVNIILANAQIATLAFAGIPGAVVQITRNILTIATMAQYIVDTEERLVVANEGLENNRQKLARSEAYRDTLKAELAGRIATVNSAQTTGLR